MEIESSTAAGAVRRNKAAESSGEVLQLVSFRLGEEEFGIEILKVQEIIRMRDITRLPNAPGFIEGVINLRGRVIPVIGLRKRLGMEALARGKETRIVIVEIAGGVFGFEVDAVSEVLRISSETVEAPPRLKQGGNEYVSGIGKLENRLLLLLDMQRLMSDSEQLLLREVAAEHAPAEMVN